MRVSALQYDPVYLDVEGNLITVEQMLENLDTDLVVLPELFASGYFFRSDADLRKVSEPVPNGPTTRRLLDWAKRYGVAIVAGLPESEAGRCYNSAVVVSSAGYVGKYRKLHLYYREKLLFEPGGSVPPVFDVAMSSGVSCRVGVMICFDWYFPETARTLALNGAEVIAHPSNLVRRDCPRAMPIRALENHVYTVTSNRTGREFAHDEELVFIGQSLICSPSGEVLAGFGKLDAGVLTVEVDPAVSADRKITAHNDLFADRRVDAYRLS